MAIYEGNNDAVATLCDIVSLYLYNICKSLIMSGMLLKSRVADYKTWNRFPVLRGCFGF